MNSSAPNAPKDSGDVSRHPWGVAQALGSALVFVLAVKFAVSPHSPLGAYIAVSMQCALGMLFFSLISNYKVAAGLTAVFSLVSSALQKIIILTVVYGTPFWEALDRFVLEIAERLSTSGLPESFSVSLWLAAVFTGIYAVGGLFIGWLAGRLPTLLLHHRLELSDLCSSFQAQRSSGPAAPRKGKWMFPALIIGVAALAFVMEYWLISSEAAIYQLIRTTAILLGWILLLRPLFRFFLGRLLRKKREDLRDGIERVQLAIPRMGSFARFAWKRAPEMSSGSWRLTNFILLLLYFGLYEA